MHVGEFPGVPKGSQDALKHGHYTAEAIESRRHTRELIQENNRLDGEIG